jgi:hypothetical protein
VPYHLIQHGLIRATDSIFWLRLYRGQEGAAAAVVTEVPGNPGLNAMNGLESVLGYLTNEYQVDLSHLTLFEIVPAGDDHTSVTIDRVSMEGEATWVRSSREEIEAIVGALPALPPHDELLEGVGALGGVLQTAVTRDTWLSYPVQDLPPFHKPFKCQHQGRFETMLAAIPVSKRHWTEDEADAGRAFLASLTEEDRAACRYHSGNWKSVADTSVAILSELGTRDDRRDFERAARARLKGRDREHLVSLFSSPITVSADRFTDGQHRSCAIRFSGAARVAVITGREDTGEFDSPWRYRGDG